MNPVLKKDMIGLLRLPRTSAIQLIFVALLALLVLATWPQQGVVTLATRAQDALQLGLILGQIILLALVVPGIAAVSITSEREQGTLEMIYASRLSPARFILGKLMSAVGFPGLLLVSGLPFVALLIYRGDVDFARMSWSYLVVITTAILLATISLAISAWCSQCSTSLVSAYVASLTICGAVLVPAAIMLSSQGGAAAQLLHGLRSLSPVAAALSLLRPRLNDFGGRPGGADPHTGEMIVGLAPSWHIFLPVAWVIIMLCVAATIFALRKAPVERDATNRAPRPRTVLRRLLFLIDPDKPRKPFGTFNPLMAKEARTNPLRSSGWMIRVFYGALFVSLSLALMAMTGGQTEHGDLLRYVAAVLVSFQICVIALVAPSLTSSSVSSEMENGTFEMLRLSHLSAGKIFWGKFLPGVIPALLPVAAMTPAYATICVIDPSYFRAMALALPVFALFVLLCCVAGVFASSLMPTTARATISAYMITTGIVVMPMVAWFSAGALIDPTVARVLAVASPLVIALNVLPGGSPQISALWVHHILIIAVATLLLVTAARMRLGMYLRQG